MALSQYDRTKSAGSPAIFGSIIQMAGMALWTYGFFVTSSPSLIDWNAYTPWWIAVCLPNIASEIGMALIFAGMIPLYWPATS